MNHDVERFERWSNTYEDSWIQRYFDGIYKFMVETVASEHSGLNPKVILDVGCGTDRLLRRAATVWPDAPHAPAGPRRVRHAVGNFQLGARSYSASIANPRKDEFGTSDCDIYDIHNRCHQQAEVERRVNRVHLGLGLRPRVRRRK